MPGGRPSKIDQVVGHRDVRDDDGNVVASIPVTAADRIVAALGAGNYLEPAAASAGIDKVTVYDWLRIGAQAVAARERAVQLAKPVPRLTAHQKRCVEFAHAVSEAEAQWEVTAIGAIEQLARGGIPVETITEKHDAQGRLVERTVKREKLAPNASVAMWRAERRFPRRWGRMDRLEVSGPDGEPIPVEVRAARIREAAEQLDASRPELTVVSENGQVNGG